MPGADVICTFKFLLLLPYFARLTRLARCRIAFDQSPSLFSCIPCFVTLALFYHFGVRQSSHKVAKTKLTILKTLRYSLEPFDIRIKIRHNDVGSLVFLSLAVFHVFSDLQLLLLLAMKPGCGQQLSRRVGLWCRHNTRPVSYTHLT